MSSPRPQMDESFPVESPQCPEGHYDGAQQAPAMAAGAVKLNPLNARKGITTDEETLELLLASIWVESPQCPEGHYDSCKNSRFFTSPKLRLLNPLNARKGITTYCVVSCCWAH